MWQTQSLHRDLNGLPQVQGLLRRRMGQGHQKLFAAPAGDQTTLDGHQPLHGLRDLAQTLITRRMAVTVVVALEMIHIQDQQRQARLVGPDQRWGHI